MCQALSKEKWIDKRREDVLDLARSIFDPRNMALSAVGRVESEEYYRNLLA